MAGYCMRSTLIGSVGHTRVRTSARSQTPFRHQHGLVVQSRSKRTCRKSASRAPLHIPAASSTDVEPQNEVTRSAQDLAQGIQEFLEESQKALSLEEAPLPEHPVGEEGTMHVADGIDASVRPAELAAVARLTCSTTNQTCCTFVTYAVRLYSLCAYCSGHQSARRLQC